MQLQEYARCTNMLNVKAKNRTDILELEAKNVANVWKLPYYV